MKKSILAFVAVTPLIAHPALAADMPLKAPPPAAAMTWAGWYLGLNAGGVWADERVSWTAPVGTPGIGGFNPDGANDIITSSPGHVRTTGFTGGGQAGYNFQSGSLVAGIEADVQYTGVDGTRSLLSTIFANPYTQSVSSDWLATLRGRLGFAAGSLLVYGTGGLAVAELKYSDNFNGLHGVGLINSSVDYTPRTGWVAGAGAEWKFAPRWSAKAEYLFVDLGSQTDIASIATGPATITHMHSFTENIARIGVHYHAEP